MSSLGTSGGSRVRMAERFWVYSPRARRKEEVSGEVSE